MHLPLFAAALALTARSPGSTAAGDDRTFVVAAQKLARIPLMGAFTVPATRFFLLRLGPGLGRPVGRVTLTPLPIPAIPAGTKSATSPSPRTAAA